MMRENDYTEFIRVLKEKCDITEVIGSYIKLERRGYNYWACCPFHHEKTPSFSINAADRYYHCFGCGKSGDVITFVKEYENVDFNQAVQILAARAGLEVPAFDDKAAEEAAARKKKKDKLSDLMRDAARFYLNTLYSGRAQEYLDYLGKRQIAPSTAKRFGLGASLDYNGLPAYLLAQGYTPEECFESGACGKTREGKLYDAEAGRLIVPIINNLDEVIGFGGRLLQKDPNRGKYVNTRETMLFDKRKNLFNINLVKKEKRAGGLSSLIILEGYMDVISLWQAGFRNVVASMGTSLTREQVRLAKRYTDSILISYDGDAAGQSANLRGLKLLEAEGVKIRVVPLPEGLDPDDVVRSRGKEGYQTCLDASMPLIDFRLLSAQRKYDLSKEEQRREFVKEAVPILKEAESETEREQLVGRVAEISKISRTAILRDLDSAPQAAPRPVPEAEKPEKPVADGLKKAARFVLAACLLSKPYATECDLSAYDFSDEAHRTVADYILAGRRAGSLRPGGLFDLMPAEGELSEILNLDYGDNLDGAGAEKYFADCCEMLRRASIEAKKARALERYAAASTEEQRREILFRINEFNKQLQAQRPEKTARRKA